MIDNLAGVQRNVTFSSLDKHMALRIDEDKNVCRYQNLIVYGRSERDAFMRFKDCCTTRQKGIVRYNNGNKSAPFDCENCACGLEILMGRNKKLPDNVQWKLWK